MGALVCGAPLAAAGALCAITGRPKLAASSIDAIDPGVTVLLITLVPFSARSSLGRTHTPLASVLACEYCKRLAKPNRFLNKIYILLINNKIILIERVSR